MADKQTEITSSLNLSTLAPVKGAKHRRKRLGFGEGSGQGKTCGKGNKGHRARSGYKSSPGFEGGQMPLHRRLPKRGFTSRKKLAGENLYSVVSIESLNELADRLTDSTITIEILKTEGFLKSSRPQVKILGKGTVNKKLVVEAHAFSAGAKEAIEKAGGEVKLFVRASN